MPIEKENECDCGVGCTELHTPTLSFAFVLVLCEAVSHLRGGRSLFTKESSLLLQNGTKIHTYSVCRGELSRPSIVGLLSEDKILPSYISSASTKGLYACDLKDKMRRCAQRWCMEAQ